MPELTIASFNTHAGLQARRNGVCEPYDLEAALLAIDADVIVVQESWTPDGGTAAVRRVAEAAGAGVVRAALRARPPRSVAPRAAQRRRARAPWGSPSSAASPPRCGAASRSARSPATPPPERGGLHVLLDVAGTPVDLVGVHLTSRLPYGPPIQLRRLHHQLPDRDRSAIVAGDCNFWGPGVLAFLPGWKRTVRGRTWPARRPHSQIDHILVRPEHRGRARRGAPRRRLRPPGRARRPRCRAARRRARCGRQAPWLQSRSRVSSRWRRARRSRCARSSSPTRVRARCGCRCRRAACATPTSTTARAAINDDFPFLLGHEAAGLVESVGPDVTDLEPGDFVILNWRAVCGTCRACRRGRPWYCFATHNATQKMTLADGTALSPALGIGAFAEKTLVAAGQCTKVDPRRQARDRGPARLRRDGRPRRGHEHRRRQARRQRRGVRLRRRGDAAIAGARLAGAHPIIAVDIDAAEAGVGRGVRRHPHHQLARHRPGGGDPRPHRRLRRRRVHRGGRASRGATSRRSTRATSPGTVVLVGVPDPSMTLELPMIEFFGRGGALKPSWYGDCLPSRDFPMLIDLYLSGPSRPRPLRERDHPARRGRGRVPQDGTGRGAALRGGAGSLTSRRQLDRVVVPSLRSSSGFPLRIVMPRQRSRNNVAAGLVRAGRPGVLTTPPHASTT